MIHHAFFGLMLVNSTDVPAIVAIPDTATHDSTAGNHDLVLNVVPEGMNWTSVENDTGDGVGWFSEPAAGVGDEDPYSVVFLENVGEMRSATITVSDDAAEADDEIITVTQQAVPV